MVGDRLDTDMKFGKNGGLKTLLVLTGVTSEEAALAAEIQPDFYLDSLSDII
jgi:ribonucleotide monophosphatase NagD (HAD superfamily)